MKERLIAARVFQEEWLILMLNGASEKEKEKETPFCFQCVKNCFQKDLNCAPWRYEEGGVG